MAIGEKLWEGKAKTTNMIIKDIDVGGIVIMYTWMADMKGMGKAKGADGKMLFTGWTKIMPNGGGGVKGHGMLNLASGDMAVVKGAGYGKAEGGKGKGLGIWHFMTMSPKLDWLNKMPVLVTQEGDPMWNEFAVTVWEWKWD